MTLPKRVVAERGHMPVRVGDAQQIIFRIVRVLCLVAGCGEEPRSDVGDHGRRKVVVFPSGRLPRVRRLYYRQSMHEDPNAADRTDSRKSTKPTNSGSE